MAGNRVRSRCTTPLMSDRPLPGMSKASRQPAGRKSDSPSLSVPPARCPSRQIAWSRLPTYRRRGRSPSCGRQ